MTNLFKSVPIASSEITPKHVYLSRRDFIKAAGVVAGSVALAACGVSPSATPEAKQPTVGPSDASISKKKDELGDPVNSFDDITHYNNYYEFSESKEAVAPNSQNFKTSPWDVEVSGLVKNARRFSVEDLIKKYQPEERIYRLRCVEAWSMVIPWVGFPLSKLIKEAGPTSDAKYVRFETLMDPKQMPMQASPFYPWPYHEGLRMDEAMNDLAILATGMYGEELPVQDGGPIRLVVPWKYGFKSIKAIIKIEFVDKQPNTMWNDISSSEYGFYANVNPEVDHPRWSQSSERRIGEFARRPTLKFNGYGEQVAHLYDGLDLRVNY
jgi:sulfoxide reductase catalytic subunit YedY